MSEPDDAPELTRAERRSRERGVALAPPRTPLPDLPAIATVRRPFSVLAAVCASAVIGLTGFAHPYLALVAVVFVGLVMAWGWALLVDMPSRRGSTAVLVVTVLAAAPAAVIDQSPPFLAWLPAGVAVGLLVLFLHQLLRSDGRPRLTETLMLGGLGIAVIASGAMYAGLALASGGEYMLAAALSALAGSTLVDLLVPRAGLRAWLLPAAMIVGAATAVGFSELVGRPSVQQAVLLGLITAGVSHALRRVLTVLPSMVSPRSQLAAGAASVLVCGVVVYVTPSLIAVVNYLWGLVRG